MKRRLHGINLDDGVELSSKEDFDRLYVAARPEEVRRLGEWMDDPRAEALILAGQIGTGKTTLLNDLLRHAPYHGVVRVELDQTPLEETQGAFLAVLFGSLLKNALELGCSCKGLGVALSDFGTSGRKGWKTVRDLFLVAPASISGTDRVRQAYDKFSKNAQQVQMACTKLVERIETKIGAMPAIIAEGVDKFAVSRAGYIGLSEVLDFLGAFKTLYEANAIHLFAKGSRWVASDKLFVGPMPNDAIEAMFAKRLGNYAPFYRDAFPLLVEYAGGNARQALRLLNGYYFSRTQRGNDRNAALAIAAHRVTQDLLQFGFESFPADILSVLKRDGFIEAGVLARPETADPARDILYRNWAFLKATPNPGTTRWPLQINPLVSDAIAWERETPEPPELTAVREWAKDHGISPMGLSMPEDEKGQPRSWSQIWNQLSSTESAEDALNIVSLLEEVASSLFSANRQDRIMVSYRDPQNLNIAIDYLIGKAGTYCPFSLREIHLVGGEGVDPVSDLMAFTKEKDESNIYVVYMEGDWTDQQLEAIDRLRDRLVDLQMLWFSEHQSLLRYLPHWPQFRQFLRFYVLEDDFLAALSQDEIETDLAILRETDGKNQKGIKRLQRVLTYMIRRRTGT